MCRAKNDFADLEIDTFLEFIPIHLFNPIYLKESLLALLISVLLLWAVALRVGTNQKNTRVGEEHGSAKWATKKDMQGFIDLEDKSNNVLLTQNSAMKLSVKKYNIKYDKNKNFLVIGGSGSGKTRYYVKPNILQCNTSYFVTDPKGTLLKECGDFFAKAGYKIKVFDTINFANSMKYNPLTAIRTKPAFIELKIGDKAYSRKATQGYYEQDVLSFCNCLIANTNGDKGGATGDNKFFEDAEKLLYNAIIAYMFEALPAKDRTLITMINLLNEAKASETNENFESELDKRFKRHATGKQVMMFESVNSKFKENPLAYFSWWKQGYREYSKRLIKFLSNTHTTKMKGYIQILKDADNDLNKVHSNKDKLEYYNIYKDLYNNIYLAASSEKEIVGQYQKRLDKYFQIDLKYKHLIKRTKLTNKKSPTIRVKRKFQTIKPQLAPSPAKIENEWSKWWKYEFRNSNDTTPQKSKPFDGNVTIEVSKPHTLADSFALRKYNEFKTAAGKTLKSIIISCNVRMNPLGVKEVQDIIDGDEMELAYLGDGKKTVSYINGKQIVQEEKSIVFAITSDTDLTFNFLFALMIWQTINGLCNRSLLEHGGSLPMPVHFILDEFANIDTIPDIETQIAVLRSRKIYLTIILQDLAQIQNRYDKAADIILGNCDTTLYLGKSSLETCKWLSERMGQETIDQMNTSKSSGQSKSVSENNSTLARDLMQAAEIQKLDGRDALVLINGSNPFRDRKYMLETHKNYKYIDPGHKGVAKGVKEYSTKSYRDYLSKGR